MELAFLGGQMMAASDLRDGVTCGILDRPSGKMNPEWLWATSVDLSGRRDGVAVREIAISETMSLAVLSEMFDYNYWARDRQLQACAGLTEEQFLRPLGNSSLRCGTP